MELLLLRHAKTAGNLVKRYIGCRTDEPLAPEGIEQAGSIISSSVVRVYVSPMKRAVETASIRFPNAERIIIPDFREMDFGDFEGRSANEMTDDADYRAWVDANCETMPTGGSESWTEYSERVCSAFLTLIREASERGEEKLVTVSHGGTIMAAMSRWALPKKPYYMWNPRHCSGYAVSCGIDKWDGSTEFPNWRSIDTDTLF
ncbi:MAG: phosphoglycerate mutase family protein [Oscillospiraceae bacterium]|jgi:alpha-ribazole phosphatase|nr:phosphoglycerate mutase family protein [Oscillospiraceae bacterium]